MTARTYIRAMQYCKPRSGNHRLFRDQRRTITRVILQYALNKVLLERQESNEFTKTLNLKSKRMCRCGCERFKQPAKASCLGNLMRVSTNLCTNLTLHAYPECKQHLPKSCTWVKIQVRHTPEKTLCMCIVCRIYGPLFSPAAALYNMERHR